MYDLQLSPLLHSKAVQNKVEGILVSILGKRATGRQNWWEMRMVRIWVRKVYASQRCLPCQKIIGLATCYHFDLEHLTSSL